jgi:hypothetical protein
VSNRGWLKIGSDESKRLIDEIEVSLMIWEAYEGCFELPRPDRGHLSSSA